MHPTRCPTHAQPDGDVLDAWPCPDDCLDFLAELERRIEDVKVSGNFTRMWRDDNGVFYRQKFRGHEPVEVPQRWAFKRKPEKEQS